MIQLILVISLFSSSIYIIGFCAHPPYSGYCIPIVIHQVTGMYLGYGG